jgi:Na+-transporting methylmalonyl-CoA/oxaloacetate decarboxylase gamma subunit
MKRLLLVLSVLAALPAAAQEVVEVVEVVPVEEISRAELFRQADPTGGLMTITAVTVVFSSLVMLFLIFKGIGLLVRRISAPKPAKVVEVATVATVVEDVEGDVFAAIAVAMFQYSRDLHDVENTVLTINRGAKAYSPWSSKIYGLRRMPNKR